MEIVMVSPAVVGVGTKEVATDRHLTSALQDPRTVQVALSRRRIVRAAREVCFQAVEFQRIHLSAVLALSLPLLKYAAATPQRFILA